MTVCNDDRTSVYQETLSFHSIRSRRPSELSSLGPVTPGRVQRGFRGAQ